MPDQDDNPFEPEETPDEQNRRIGRMIRENADKRLGRVDAAFHDAARVEGVPVIFSEHMEPVVILREPLFSKPGAPVFICRSREDLLAAIDRHFWREMGIEDPRL